MEKIDMTYQNSSNELEERSQFNKLSSIVISYPEEIAQWINTKPSESRSSIIATAWATLEYRYKNSKKNKIGSCKIGDNSHLYIQSLDVLTESKNFQENKDIYRQAIPEGFIDTCLVNPLIFDAKAEGFAYCQKKELCSVINFNVLGDKFMFHLNMNVTQLFIENIFIDKLLSFQVHYNASVYNKKYLEQVVFNFFQLLFEVMNKPNTSLNQLDVVSENEKELLLGDFVNPNGKANIDKNVVDFFMDQVEKNPHNIALIFGDDYLTYKQLNTRSNQFAAYLSQRLTKEDKIIGVKLQRSEMCVVVMLAILKMGYCCAPLDPKTPSKRFQEIKKNLCSVIDQKNVDEYLATKKGFYNAEPPKHNNELAYIIYTSGSTGQPKGCILTHSGIANHVLSKIEMLDLGETDALCHTSKFYFVGAIWQLWATLAVGGNVVLTTLEELQEITLLLDKAIASNVKFLEVIPSQINTIFALGDQFKLKKLNTLILTGERLTPAYVNKFFQINPEIKIINTYGQTECSDVTSYYVLEKPISDNKVLIGKPIKNCSIYILNESGKLLPIKGLGEICTSGMPVCKGYLNQPDLTNATFVENPFNHDKVLYRTGDLGRWLPNGNIEILGRLDDQVKIRGFRIDLGEIENAILKNEHILKAEIVVYDTSDNEKQIIAYYISNNEPTINEWRVFLKQYLPEYMIPLHFMKVRTFPLMPNGKVDKKNLPAPKENNKVENTNYIAPKTPLEKKIVNIWEKLLNRSDIGIEDDFFVLGGHSLKINLLIIRYQKNFDVRLGIKQLYDHVTISSHAELISSQSKQVISPIKNIPGARSYELSDAQTKLYYLSKLDEGDIEYNMSFFEHLEGAYEVKLFQESLSLTLKRHETLRTYFKKNSKNELRQYILPNIDVLDVFSYFDLSDSTSIQRQINLIIRQDEQQFLPIEEGPLLKTYLLRVDKEKYVFYGRLHQLISDAASIEVFLKDLISFYNAIKVNMSPNLASLPIQYKDYAFWINRQRSTSEFEKSKDFWSRKLSNLPAIPVDFPKTKERPAIKTSNGHLLELNIKKATVEKLQKYCLDKNSTFFNGVVAIWYVLMNKYTQREDLILATRSSGRYRSEFENQIGNYLNTVVLRTHVADSNNFDTIFEKTKNTILSSFEHQNYYFDWLIEDLNIVTPSNRNPVYDTMLTFEDKSQEVQVETPNTAVVIDRGNSSSKIDILVNFELYPNHLNIELQFNKDVYDLDLMKQVLLDYQAITKYIIDQSHKPISNIDITNRVKTKLRAKNIQRMKAFTKKI